MEIAVLAVARRDLPSCQTPEEHVITVKKMCDLLVAEEVEWAELDDWGRFSNFSLFIRPRRADGHSTRGMRTLVRRVLPWGAHIRAIYPLARAMGGRGRTAAGRQLEWKVDVDFHNYDAATNTFDMPASAAGPKGGPR